VRAAEAASNAAHQAQVAAESVLASLEGAVEAKTLVEPAGEAGLFAVAVAQDQQVWETDADRKWIEPPRQSPLGPEPVSAGEGAESVESGVQWEPELPFRSAKPAAGLHARRGPETHRLGVQEIDPEDWREDARNSPGGDGIKVVEASLPFHANLIEFPRELVATRKARPRLVEGSHAAVAEPDAQLSIFEVDPGSISIESVGEVAAEPAAPVWAVPEWTGIELDAHPQEPQEDTAPEAASVPATPALQPAPTSARLMAAVVDFALISGAFLAAAMVAAANAKELPGIREMELYAALALVVIGVLYEALFHTLAKATPGMKYAQISLCTFNDESPNREQRWARVGALLLSLLPVGLGVAWVIFDEEHLCWHDRLSQTYMRKC
jgi:uncharacterized RDD family membrane protein YckC